MVKVSVRVSVFSCSPCISSEEVINWEGSWDACFCAEVLLQCSHCSVVQTPFGRSSLGLLVLQFLRPYSFVYEGSDHTQRACSSQIHSYSTVLLLAFDYLHTLASFFFSLNIFTDNFEFFIGVAEIIDFQISVSYDFLINCPTLKLDVPSSWPLVWE